MRFLATVDARLWTRQDPGVRAAEMSQFGNIVI